MKDNIIMNTLDRIYSKDIEVFSRNYINYIKEVLDHIDTKEIRRFVERLFDARDRNAMIFFIGNGGSAATASHFANDLAFGTNDYEKPFRVMSLTDNVPVITAIGNDFGYEEIFVRQLRIYGKPGDVVVGISASGNSENLIKSFEYATTAGIHTVAITGFNGGRMKVIADEVIHIFTELKEYGPAEDVHMVLDHLIGSYLMRAVRDVACIA